MPKICRFQNSRYGKTVIIFAYQHQRRGRTSSSATEHEDHICRYQRRKSTSQCYSAMDTCISGCKTCTAAVHLSRRGATWCATCPHAGGARTSVTCACQGSSVWYLIYRGRRLINIDDFITFCDAIMVHWHDREPLITRSPHMGRHVRGHRRSS